mmetsp:Transcript_8381/g.23811  ORF Transcript_8381/g.23811 Transcript_8381/m.23811 type:complete len:234 (+) Transcript_8381:166-867(+)
MTRREGPGRSPEWGWPGHRWGGSWRRRQLLEHGHLRHRRPGHERRSGSESPQGARASEGVGCGRKQSLGSWRQMGWSRSRHARRRHRPWPAGEWQGSKRVWWNPWGWPLETKPRRKVVLRSAPQPAATRGWSWSRRGEHGWRSQVRVPSGACQVEDLDWKVLRWIHPPGGLVLGPDVGEQAAKDLEHDLDSALRVGGENELERFGRDGGASRTGDLGTTAAEGDGAVLSHHVS